MGAFVEPFDSLAAWDFGSGPTGNLVLASTSPAPYIGASRASLIQFDTSWAAARFDAAAGNVPGTTYWVSYAFYLPSWATIFADQGSFGGFNLPGFLTRNDDPMKGAFPSSDDQRWFYLFVNADTISTGRIWFLGTPYALVGDDQWHTVRFGLRLDGANSHQTFYLDNVLKQDADVDYSGISAEYEQGVAGVVVAPFDAGLFGPTDAPITIPIDSMLYSSVADPGEPNETPLAAPCTGTGLTMRVVIDSDDVTHVCVKGTWTPRLNRPAQASVTIPMEEYAGGDAGSRMRLYLVEDVGTMTTETLVFHGTILDCETDTDKDGGTTIYNAQDPMELWQWRPVRDDGADFSKPVIITDYLTGPQILEAMLINTEDSTGRTNGEGEIGGPPPTDAEGSIFLDIASGTFAGGGVDLTGAPVDWPMRISELFSLLVSTGRLDAIITPIETDGNGNIGIVDAYNGDFGDNLSADVVLQYGMGARNIQAFRWNRDMTNMVNKNWIYGGPRVQTAGDPAGDQHWCFNVQGFDVGLAYPPGGQAVDTSNNPFGPPWTNNQLGEKIFNSRDTHGVRMQVDIFDAYDEDCVPGVGTPGRDLYRYQWQVFSWFAADPRELIHVTPNPDVYVGCFGIGDLITVECTPLIRGGFSGVQRVYEYTVSWDGPQSVLNLSEIQVSSDMEGAAG